MAEVQPQVLTAAKRALRYGSEATLADAIRNEQSLGRDLELRPEARRAT
jgi:hypothetical protein